MDLRIGRFHDNSSKDISSTILRLYTDISSTDISSTDISSILLYTRVQDSYTSNFCLSKSLFPSIPTSTYTMIIYTTYMYIVSKHCGMKIQLVLSVKGAYF